MNESAVGATFSATLVDEWVRRGLRHAVVAPGSRSTPMALALAGHPDVAVHVHHDERAAAFIALGIGVATGRPAVVLTTSGTAAVELHPAVVEAHQAAVPLVAVTADRPPELRERGAPQTIDQRELYGPATRWYAEPGPPEWGHAPGWRALATDVIDRALGLRPGPVQLNLAFREPLTGPVGDVPPPEPGQGERVRPGWELTDEQVARLAPLTDSADGVIVAGARAATTPEAAAAVLELAQGLGWPVLCDHLSGCRVPHESVVTTFDPILRHRGASVPRPEVVVHLGGLLASRVTNEWLAASGAIHVGFDRYGLTPDPDGTMAESFWAAPEDVARALLDARRRRSAPVTGGRATTRPPRWARLESAARAALDQTLAARPRSEPAVAAALVAGLGPGTELVVSSSMPVRDLEWYVPAAPGVQVRSNRGANGIDGVVSTAVGVALTGRPTAALVGDVAFLHDTNALVGLATRSVDLLVVVIDNDGGGIFSFLPQAAELPEERFEQLFGTPHGTDLPTLVRAHHLEVGTATSVAEVAEAVGRWRHSGGVQVVVVPSDRRANVADHRALQEAVAAAIAG